MYLSHSHTAIVLYQAPGVGKCQQCYVLVTNVHWRDVLQCFRGRGACERPQNTDLRTGRSPTQTLEQTAVLQRPWNTDLRTGRSPTLSLTQTLEQAAVLQIVLDDDGGDGVEHKLHVLGVGGAGEVSVDLLRVLPLVQVLKLTLDVGGHLLVDVGA